jgi:APA family basic amino acid/polyamine antiporter
MTPTPKELKRQIGLMGAVLMGLGSIVGTGVFVSLGTVASIAGWGTLGAIVVSALVATCNGFNAAQLSASHPVSGGTYEYGYRYLNRWWGFTAGWLFLWAKCASSATAALGFAGYLVNLLAIDPQYLTGIGVGTVVVFTAIAGMGITRANWANTIIVAVTVGALLFFGVAGIPTVIQGWGNFSGSQSPTITDLFQATALMFVAYTGYGRIATMGEEVVNPKTTIPQAMMVTLGVSMVLYSIVAVVGLSGGLTAGTAPLVQVAQQFAVPYGGLILTIGAITAMLGVLLNLILGLSRVLLAMARRKDMPQFLTRINRSGTSPVPAVVTIGLIVALLTLVGNVQVTWSFSAFNVLIYYSITNFCALQLPPADRLYPRWLSYCGLIACGFLAFWVEWHIWLVGLALIGAGLLWCGYRKISSS